MACLHQLITDITRQHAARTAVVCDGASLTYAELESRSNRLARRLQSHGVQGGELVGICVERSIEMVAGPRPSATHAP